MHSFHHDFRRTLIGKSLKIPIGTIFLAPDVPAALYIRGRSLLAGGWTLISFRLDIAHRGIIRNGTATVDGFGTSARNSPKHDVHRLCSYILLLCIKQLRTKIFHTNLSASSTKLRNAISHEFYKVNFHNGCLSKL
jgi:hypothetical protein